MQGNKFDTVRFIYLTVGRTKFAPDRLFASIAKTFYNSDVWISEMHDISISKKSGKVTVLHWKLCYQGGYSVLSNYKPRINQCVSDPVPYEPIKLSDEKLRQLGEQHRKYKQDTPD